MFITTFVNSAVFWVIRPSTYTGPLRLLGLSAGGFIDALYGAFTKLFINSQKEVDKIVQAAISQEDTSQLVAIITGANSGIGYETAKAIGRAGYHTILACRNRALGEKAVANLVRETSQTNFELMILDLASFKSVREFVTQFKSKYQQLSILVNNAGVVKYEYTTTADGIEMQFGTNHIGHFLLTTELLDVMKQTRSARIINVSSLASYLNLHIDTALVEDPRRYNARCVYRNSKLTNVMFSATLARKLEGTGVTANSLHPGWVATPIFPSIKGVNWILNFILINPTHGALTSIYLALSPEVSGISGKYFVRCQPTYAHPSASSIDEQDALWRYSEQLIAKHTK